MSIKDMAIGANGDKNLEASIVITSRNRCSDVLRAVASCRAQIGVRLEVLVYDDNSEDDTVEALKAHFPECRVFASRERTGYIVNRNRGFVDAKGRIVFSLDDDAYFSDPGIVADIVRWFDDESIGAVAIPYIEPLNRRSHSSLQKPVTLASGAEVRSYVGCAHAVRRSAANAMNGYREFFVHQREEAEFCLRLRSAGWKIVLGQSRPIVHMVSPKRETDRVFYYAGRNLILAEALNAPMPEGLVRSAIAAVGFVRYRFTWRHLPLRLRALWSGVMDAIRFRHLRKPVTHEIYRKHCSLSSHGPMDWNDEIPRPPWAAIESVANSE